jgi:hypothetical protein
MLFLGEKQTPIGILCKLEHNKYVGFEREEGEKENTNAE